MTKNNKNRRNDVQSVVIKPQTIEQEIFLGSALSVSSEFDLEIIAFQIILMIRLY